MERARPVGSGFSPLDEELGLFSSALTPTQQEHLVHLAAFMPFAQAGKMLESLLGVQVSEATVRRLTEQAGARYEAVQTAQSLQMGSSESLSSQEPSSLIEPVQPIEPVPSVEAVLPVPLKQVISSDGAYVLLVTGEWAEVRTVAIGEIKKKTATQGMERIKGTDLSYFSRMTDSETFEDLAEVEMRRRRVRDALASCAVTDGALWLQSFIDLHRPDAVRILDFAHAAQYVNAIGEAVCASGRRLPKEWLEGVLHRLKHEGPDRVLAHLSSLCERCKNEEIDKKLKYLSTRQALMQYPTFQQDGWPIGSGMVESANKQVMQSRLKGPGMRWAPSHVNPMLALRTAVCNDRWSPAWQEIQMQAHHQRQLRRQARATTRLTQDVASTLILLARFRPPTPPVAVCSPSSNASHVSSPPATLPGSSHPSPHHIWRRTPACRPKLVAKI